MLQISRTRSCVLVAGHNVPINLHQTNVILCSDKKGKGHQTQLSPSEAQACLRERDPLQASPPALNAGTAPSLVLPPVPCPAEQADLSWQHPQGQVSRLHPAVITEGARLPAPSGPQAALIGAWFCGPTPRMTAATFRPWRWGWGRGLHLLKAWA